MPGTIYYILTEREVVAARQVQYVRRATSSRSLGHNAIILFILWLLVFSLNFADRDSLAADALSACIFCASALLPVTLVIAFAFFLACMLVMGDSLHHRTLRA